MPITFPKVLSSSVQQQIVEEERNYNTALRLDAPFAVLKEIRNKIKMLKLKSAKQAHKQQPDENR